MYGTRTNCDNVQTPTMAKTATVMSGSEDPVVAAVAAAGGGVAVAVVCFSDMFGCAVEIDTRQNCDCEGVTL